MEIVINRKLKIVEFWLRKTENISDQEIIQIREKYGVNNYKAVIYHSGTGCLLDETTKLILHNRILKQ